VTKQVSIVGMSETLMLHQLLLCVKGVDHGAQWTGQAQGGLLLVVLLVLEPRISISIRLSWTWTLLTHRTITCWWWRWSSHKSANKTLA